MWVKMKLVKVPINQEELDLLESLVTSLNNSALALKRYKKPYDRITILRLMRKAINKTLKATGN